MRSRLRGSCEPGSVSQSALGVRRGVYRGRPEKYKIVVVVLLLIKMDLLF